METSVEIQELVETVRWIGLGSHYQAHRGDVIVRVAQRGKPDAGAFDEGARLVHLGDRHVAGLEPESECLAHRLGQITRLRGDDEVAALRAARRAQHALRAQHFDRFAHGRPADAKLRGQLRLGLKPVTRSKRAGHERVAQLDRDLVGRGTCLDGRRFKQPTGNSSVCHGSCASPSWLRPNPLVACPP